MGLLIVVTVTLLTAPGNRSAAEVAAAIAESMAVVALAVAEPVPVEV